MADRLTQLQDCLDDLATQMFASIRYIQTKHTYTPIPGQPDMAPSPNNPPDNTQAPEEHIPDTPQVFSQALRELARDLVLKEQQIEYLISVLPGIGSSEEAQNTRIKGLEAELRDMDALRDGALKRREAMLDAVSGLASQCKRVY